MNLTKALTTIGGWTVLSRITGLFREMLVAQFLGAGLISDAFFVAFRLPNLFRSLFAEGAFNAAFIPLFTGKLTQEGLESAKTFAEQCFSVLSLILIFFIIIGEIYMPIATQIMAPGFSDFPGKMDLTITLSRITFPYLFFIALVSLQSGVLNGLDRFAAAAGTPVLLNITAILSLIFLIPYCSTPGHAMAWGVFLSGIVQFLWLVYSVSKVGFFLKPVWPKLSKDVILMLKRVGPGAIGAGVYQLNLVINTLIASRASNGAVSYLNYADRVNQLPLGVVGIALGTALLPLLTRQLRSGKFSEALESQNRGIELCLLLTIPACLAFITLSEPIISLLFERGSFTSSDTIHVAEALVAFALGLPAYVLVKVLTPGFFAREDTKTPIIIAIFSMIINVILNIILMKPLAHVGMALSTAIAAWFNVFLLAIILYRRRFLKPSLALSLKLVKILISGLIMSIILIIIKYCFELLTSSIPYNRIWMVMNLVLLIFSGCLVYVIATLKLKVTTKSELLSFFKRN